jgi:ribosomal protein S18 acetylase RimI-like enzyme
VVFHPEGPAGNGSQSRIVARPQQLDSTAGLAAYARIPIAFEVSERYEVTVAPDGRVTLTSHALAHPYTKDYDALGDGPLAWPRQFDTSAWAFFLAGEHGAPLGGAAIACRTPGLDMLEGRDDLAVLWDIRVAPAARGSGVGRALFQAACDWATASGFRSLRIETQNTNVAACRFYARHGCVLTAARPGAYPELPEDVQLIWEKALQG